MTQEGNIWIVEEERVNEDGRLEAGAEKEKQSNKRRDSVQSTLYPCIVLL